MNSVGTMPTAPSTDWDRISAQLDTQGWTVLPNLMSRDACEVMAALYNHPEYFRSQVIMARHGFGRGEYRYFAYPLPPLVVELRTDLYRHLAPIANIWQQRMNIETRFPPEHADSVRQRGGN